MGGCQSTDNTEVPKLLSSAQLQNKFKKLEKHSF